MARCIKPRMNVLLVEDDLSLSDGIARILLSAGHAVDARTSGVEALEATRQGRFDLVLLDIGLPGMNGYDVVRRLRADPRTQAATVIAVTGDGQEADRQRALEAGFDLHLVKPVAPEQLAGLFVG